MSDAIRLSDVVRDPKLERACEAAYRRGFTHGMQCALDRMEPMGHWRWGLHRMHDWLAGPVMAWRNRGSGPCHGYSPVEWPDFEEPVFGS